MERRAADLKLKGRCRSKDKRRLAIALRHTAKQSVCGLEGAPGEGEGRPASSSHRHRPALPHLHELAAAQLQAEGRLRLRLRLLAAGHCRQHNPSQHRVHYQETR